jgi:hypothetical protein
LGDDDALRLQLSHLTALTDLQLSGSNGFGVFHGNVLPPNLVALRATDRVGVLSVDPLRPLQQLQRLAMKCASSKFAATKQPTAADRSTAAVHVRRCSSRSSRHVAGTANQRLVAV